MKKLYLSLLLVIIFASSAFAQFPRLQDSVQQNKYNFSQFGRETLGFIIQPTKWDGSDWLKLGLLGAGTFLGFGLIKNFEPVTLFILAPGALLTMGILIGIVNYWHIKLKTKKEKVVMKEVTEELEKIKKEIKEEGLFR